MSAVELSEIPDDAVLEVAEVMYSTYCEGVGGKAFNGDPLPDWDEFSNDESKKVQSDAWALAARTTIGYVVNAILEA